LSMSEILFSALMTLTRLTALCALSATASPVWDLVPATCAHRACSELRTQPHP